MKERPILFSGAMVRAILDGTKTQTRRVIKGWPSDMMTTPYRPAVCPYGAPGDRLWVREAWAPYDSADTPLDDEEIAECARYRADGVTYIYGSEGVMRPLDMYGVPPHREIPGGPHRWRPSIHMPRWACRLVLEVTDVRVERLQDISEEDARAEGVDPDCPIGNWREYAKAPHVYAFALLWDDLNEKRGFGWDANPWVWVVSFRRLDDVAPRGVT